MTIDVVVRVACGRASGSPPLTGITDCSAGGGDREVDWQVTAKMVFIGVVLGTMSTTCTTDSFVAPLASRFAGGTPVDTFVTSRT